MASFVNRLGFGFPLERKSGGIFNRVVDIEAIKSNLIGVILTEPGERRNNVNFGTKLRDLYFEQPHAVLYSTLKQRISNSIRTFEPWIVVKELNIGQGIEDTETADQIIRVEIAFSTKDDLTSVDNLVIKLSERDFAS